MKTQTQIICAIGIASFFPAAVTETRYGFPVVLAAAVFAAALPDILCALRRDFIKAGITVVPDPLGPDGAVIADAVKDACGLACASGRDVFMRIASAPLGAVPCSFYFDDAGNQLVFFRGGNDEIRRFPVPRFISAVSAPFVLNSRSQILLKFSPADKSAPLRCVPVSYGWTHSLSVAAAVFLIPFAAGFPSVAVICALSVITHLILDSFGFEQIEWPAPLTKRTYGGFGMMKFNSDSAAANTAVSAAATAAVIINFILNTQYLLWWRFCN